MRYRNRTAVYVELMNTCSSASASLDIALQNVSISVFHFKMRPKEGLTLIFGHSKIKYNSSASRSQQYYFQMNTANTTNSF